MRLGIIRPEPQRFKIFGDRLVPPPLGCVVVGQSEVVFLFLPAIGSARENQNPSG